MTLRVRLRVAGVDEAGRGPLAGPVVAAAVILNPARPIRGLADSKALEPQERESFLGGVPSELTVRDVMAILELRISLEAEAAGLAAVRRTDENLKEMRRALDEFQQHVAARTGNSPDSSSGNLGFRTVADLV